MSELTYPEISILVRNRLNLPASDRLRLQSLVNTALQRLGKQVAQDKDKRQYMLTDRATTTATLTGGKVDLTSLIASTAIQLEYMMYGWIWPATGTSPLQWKRGPDLGTIAGPFDGVFPHCWLEGKTLYTKGTNNAVLTGTLEFAVPFIATLAQLSSTLNDDLLDLCVVLAQISPDQFVEHTDKP